MKSSFFLITLLAFSFSLLSTAPEKRGFQIKGGNTTVEASFFFWPEFFYGKNLTLLNNNNPDEIIYFRHFVDAFLSFNHKKDAESPELIKGRCCIRNRTVWGNTQSILQTNDQTVKDLGAVFGSHRHGLTYCDLWLRELWIELSLNDLMCVPWCNRHTITVGAFPFELGRGISLGYGYPSMPSVVGFFLDASIDQYAFGGLLRGDLVKDHLTYDVYGAIFNNLSATFDQTNAVVRSQRYGRRTTGARGFGTIQYLGAARLKWHPLGQCETRKLYVEPYGLYHYNPDVRIELLEDGVSRLSTFGLMVEGTFGCLEWGFEYAFNRGGQRVFGIDRNAVILENQQGIAVVANSEVTNRVGTDDALVTPPHQAIIDSTPRTQLQNGEVISPDLRNKQFRFQDPYLIRYRGQFFVIDASYIFTKDVLKVSAALGIATGDSDPRLKAALLRPGDTRVVDYDGFIAINETYAGRRVTSTLFFNGFGAFPRVIDFGIIDVTPNSSVLNATGFTNLIYTGASLDYQYAGTYQKWHVNPNVLFYWQEERSTQFIPKKLAGDPAFSTPTPRLLGSYLGAELNLLAEIEVLKGLTFFAVGALFLPGLHFKHMKGYPPPCSHKLFTKERQSPRQSVLGDDAAYLINIGFKFYF